MMLNDVKGVIFDLDGTLIDSMGVWDNIAFEYLKVRGRMPRIDLGDKLRNMSMQQGAEYVKINYGLQEPTKEIISGINAMIEVKYQEEFPLKEGAVPLIERLASRGVSMCVATVTDYHLAEECLKRCQILKYFHGIFSCSMLGIGKDDPKIFEYAMEKLGTSKSNTYVIEDSLYAIQTAKKAGFKVVAVYDKAAEKENWQIRETADIYVTTMEELY